MGNFVGKFDRKFDGKKVFLLFREENISSLPFPSLTEETANPVTSHLLTLALSL